MASLPPRGWGEKKGSPGEGVRYATTLAVSLTAASQLSLLLVVGALAKDGTQDTLQEFVLLFSVFDEGKYTALGWPDPVRWLGGQCMLSTSQDQSRTAFLSS